jgi:hypothetical protein
LTWLLIDVVLVGDDTDNEDRDANEKAVVLFPLCSINRVATNCLKDNKVMMIFEEGF